MPLALVRTGELAPADLARKRLLARVCANVRGQVIGTREGARAYATLERLVARVDTDVAGELVGSGEAPRTPLDWAWVWALVYRCLAWTHRVFARFHL